MLNKIDRVVVITRKDGKILEYDKRFSSDKNKEIEIEFQDDGKTVKIGVAEKE